jgi:hypothetical protein
MISQDDIDAFTVDDEQPDVFDWLNEIEVYSTRYERLCANFAELDAHAWRDLMAWLDAAYTVGWKRGRGLE